MRALSAASSIWAQLWFQSETTRSLDVVRIGVGLCLLASYAGLTPQLLELYGDAGWVPREALSMYLERWEYPSLHYHFTEDWHWWAFHGAFLLACLAFTAGWQVRWAKWVVLVGHISYGYRNPMITYGVDTILASATFLVCLAPIGTTLSLDRWLSVRAARRVGTPVPVPPSSPFHFTLRRLLQIQIAVVMLFSGLAKLRGDWWWSGDALWIALNNYEFANVPIGWLAAHYELVNVLTYGTLVLELGFAFLVWQRATRPFVLAAVVAMHVGIAVLMGLYLFSAAMLVCDSAFLRREWVDRLGAWIRGKAAGP